MQSEDQPFQGGLVIHWI